MRDDFKIPPQVRMPSSARWYAVLPIGEIQEIWISALHLRERPYAFYPVLCRREEGKVLPAFHPPLTEQELITDPRIFDLFPHRFFWSKGESALILQHLQTFEYSDRSEIIQRIYRGPDLSQTESLGKEKLRLLPDASFVEVYPEMHPER